MPSTSALAGSALASAGVNQEKTAVLMSSTNAAGKTIFDKLVQDSMRNADNAYA